MQKKNKSHITISQTCHEKGTKKSPDKIECIFDSDAKTKVKRITENKIWEDGKARTAIRSRIKIGISRAKKEKWIKEKKTPGNKEMGDLVIVEWSFIRDGRIWGLLNVDVFWRWGVKIEKGVTNGDADAIATELRAGNSTPSVKLSLGHKLRK